jgi:uncharacterized protein YbaR (Trm112 family)
MLPAENRLFKQRNQRQEHKMSIDPSLLEILACPKCKSIVELNGAKDGLICHQCGLLYHIRDGIPIMLIDEATPIESETP